MKKKQNGFGIVEILLIVALVGLLGVIGWLVYDRVTDKDKDGQSTNTAEKVEPKNTPATTEAELKKTVLKTFEVSYDGSWKVTEQKSEVNACGDGRTREVLELAKEQKSITIIANDCGKDFPSDASIEYGISDNKVTIPNKNLVLCGAEGDEGGFCTAGDGQLLVGGGVREYDETKNNYFISFHNAASEDTSLATLADIYKVIESVKPSR